MKKTALTTLIIIGTMAVAMAQNVNIPDANFKAALISNGVDANSDGEIQVSEAESQGQVNCKSKNIKNLTGIEAFINITILNCPLNQIDSLDLSSNSKLQRVFCNNNALEYLKITSNIIDLECQNNKLTSLDLVNLNWIIYLYCNVNKITTLDLLKASKLVELKCNNNELRTLDISKCKKLKEVYCSSNKLESLNFKNGNNGNITAQSQLGGLVYKFNTTSNPNLACIQVDDSSSSRTKWVLIDPTSHFSEDCSGEWTASIGAPQRIEYSVYPSPTTGVLTLKTSKSIEQIQVLDITGKVVKSFIQPMNQIDVTILPSGIYTLQIMSSEGVGYSKFVKY